MQQTLAMGTLDFRPARPQDYPAIRALLAGEGLPSEDVAAGLASRFHVAAQDGTLLACAGLELYEADALLRSVAVAGHARRRELGRTLVSIAERDAAVMGVRHLYLLTTTAAEYFSALGYRPADRAMAPETVRSSAQFRLLCPASAVCMTKDLPG